ncbi:TIGR00266 family protein [Candidatus Dojkabacteria bacterium]|nr:TIGR00266 family protein [Candidatus Dojkabacteria bacterium]
MANQNQVTKVTKKEFVEKGEVGSKGITYRTIGTTLQALSVQLDENEHIYSEAGKMSWMTNNVEMSTHGQGCSRMISRLFTQESIFVNKFTCTSGTGIVTFTTDQAGKIIPLQLNTNSPGIIFQKGAYLCSEEGIERKIAFTKRISAGLFGGKGFILQKVEGAGKVHLVADGEAVMYELKDGQEIAVDQGNLVAYEDTVDFDIQSVKGPFNWLFGGEGFFLGVLRGPGKVWLQTRKFGLAGRNYYQQNATQSFASRQILGCVISLLFFGCIFASIFFDMLANR